MPLSQEAIQKVLGLQEKHIPLEPEEMARDLVVTFYPEEGQIISPRVKAFGERLKEAFFRLGVKVVPYEEALIEIPRLQLLRKYFRVAISSAVVSMKKIFNVPEDRYHMTLKIFSKIRKDRKIREEIKVIALGEGETGNLPMDNVASFTHSTVVTILDMPDGVENEMDFYIHFDTAFQLFAHHMTNIVIGVGESNWILYNFNASHPVYPISENFEKNLLYSLIPKLSSPIKPPQLREFILRKEAFSVGDAEHSPFVKDLTESGPALEKTGLYPKGKAVHDLAFRSEFYEWIGSVHLDHRSGMSFGFLARQMPVKLPPVWLFEDAKKKFGEALPKEKDYFFFKNRSCLILEISKKKIVVQVPDVWVLTQRSGANKTNMDPHKDTIKIGLVNGRMILETPKGLKLKSFFKPSFDTKVILAHAVGNAIFAAVARFLNPSSIFAKQLEKNGIAISHWHGYINPSHIPKGWHVYGQDKPPVSCSSPQSAVYALEGKEKAFGESIQKGEEYLGDVHIEPQHGTNINYSSLKELGEFLGSNEDISVLGNKYLKHYNLT